MTNEQILARDQARLRREAMIRQVADTLHGTLRVIPIGPDVDPQDIRVEMTDDSARVLAPLVEAVEILEAIIWSSDGCVGHRDCAHSMEPWQRARALLAGKWKAYEDREPWPPARPADKE